MAVRNESVRLSLDDAGYSTGMAKAAAATALLDHHLDALDKHGTTASRRFTSMTKRADNFATSLGGMNTALGATNQGLADFGGNDGIGRFTRAASAGDSSINQLTGHQPPFAWDDPGTLAWPLGWTQPIPAATLGPGLIPIAAVGVPAVTGLATALAAAGTAGAGALVAFQGVGDAISAMEKARLEPTVANLEAAQEAMSHIGPDAAEFVTAFQDLRPVLGEIRDSAAAGLFPGLTEALDSFEELAPRIGTLLEEVNRASGEAMANGVESLTTERWTPFFDFLSREMPAAVTSLSKIVGDLAHGAAEMWMSFDPGNDAFLGWLEDVASGFDDWASSAQGRQDIEGFLDYVRQTGPQVQESFVAIVDALTQLVQAAAPLGGPVLEGVTALAKGFSAIADSDLGTPLLAVTAALALFNRTAKMTGAVMATSLGGSVLGSAKSSLTGMGAALTTVTSAQQRASMSTTAFAAAERERAAAIKGGLGTIGKSAGVIGALAVATSGLGESAGVANTATLGLMGTMAGPWGATIGASVGLTMDLKAAMDDLHDRMQLMDEAAASGDFNLMLQERNKHLEEQSSWMGQLGGFVSDPLGGIGNILGGDAADLALGGDAAADSFRDLGDAIRGATTDLSGNFSGMLSGTIDGLRQTASSLDAATLAAEGFESALAGLSGWLDKREAFANVDTAVKSLAESLKDGFSPEVAANVTATGRSIEQAFNAIKNPTARENFIDAQIAGLEKLASGAGPKARAEIEGLIQKLRALDKANVNPKVDINDVPAKNKAAAVNKLLRDIDRSGAKPKVDAEVDAAMNKIGMVRAEIGGIPQYIPVTIAVAVKRIGGSVASLANDVQGMFGSGDAMGGMHYNGVRTFALGGMDRPNSHLPEFAGPGPTRMWREPETKGESYIPWANDHRRPRAKSVLEQTAALFGGQVEWFATGGMSDWRDHYPSLGATHSSSGGNDPALTELLGSLQWFTRGLHEMSAKELKIRLRDLDLTEKQFSKILDKREERAKKEADADKARLESMREAQRSLEEQVAGLFKSDAFGKGEAQYVAVFPDGSRMDLGSDIDSISGEQGAYLQRSGATITNESGVGGAAGIIEGDIANLQQSIELMRELRKKGFNGPAFQELVGENANDPETLSAYAGMSRGDLANIEKLYGQRDQLMGVAGNVAGKDFNADIKGLRKDTQESATHLRNVLQENKQFNRRLESIERVLQKAPQETGAAVGAAVNGAASDGARGRGPR